MAEVTKVSTSGYYERAHNYSRIVMVDEWIFMANSAGVDPKTGRFSEDPREQAEQLLSNIEESLNLVDSSLRDIVRMVITIPSRGDIFPVQDYIGARMKGIDPAMTLICSPLGSDLYKVEIEVTAYRGAGSKEPKRIISGMFADMPAHH